VALPLVVYSGDAEPMGPAFKAPNGAIYQVVVYESGSNTIIAVYKCSDPDTGSFSSAGSDSNNDSGASRPGAAWAHACQYEHFIFIPYVWVSGGEQYVDEYWFNTATDSMTGGGGSRRIYSGGPGEPPSAPLPGAMLATPNYLYCLHPSDDEKVHGTAYSRCMVSYRDLDGTTWNNSSELNSGNQNDVDIHGLAVNESENAVVIYQTTTFLYAVAWNRSSFGTAATSGNIAVGEAQAVSYMDGSTNRIILRVEAPGDNTTYARRWTSTGTTVTNVATGEVGSSSESGSGSRGGLARWGTTLYAWLNNNSSNPAYADSTDHGATWGAPTQHSNPSNNLTEHPWANAYARNGQLKLGIVYKEGTTQLSYDERSITNVTAPGFASARTPVRQNRIFVDA
jgi:hypothetical protein